MVPCPEEIVESDLWDNEEKLEGQSRYSHGKSYVRKFDS